MWLEKKGHAYLILFFILGQIINSTTQKYHFKTSICIFAQKHLRKYQDTYCILQNKDLQISGDSFGAKILRDDCTLP